MRDFLMFGSAVLMALAAMPATRAAADEVYLCGDGRTLELRHGDRSDAGRSDPCVTAWAEAARQAPVAPKRDGAQGSEPKQVLSSAILVHTSAVVNAEEVPSEGPMTRRGAERARHVVTVHAGRGRRVARKAGMDGLRYVGDGIYVR